MKAIDLQELSKYLKEKGISPTRALNIIQRAVEKKKPRGPKFTWKMMRLQMYIWERHKEYREDPPHKGLGKRIDTIKRTCKLGWYLSSYKVFHKFPDEKFIYENECKKLADLVSEPRQRKYFVSKYLRLESDKKKNMPQPLIDKLR